MRRVEIMRRVESEFGQRFWDVVRGFASDGYASGTTAKALGFSGQDQFRRLQNAYGISIQWPAHGQDNANKEPRGVYTRERAEKRLATMRQKGVIK